MLTTVATFPDQPRAELARGRLASEGIDAALKDHHLVGVHWLLSVAVRGVKLQVSDADSARASAVLAESFADLLEEDATGVARRCEFCGSDNLTPYSAKRFLGALTLFPFWTWALLVGIPRITWSASWRCLNCYRKW